MSGDGKNIDKKTVKGGWIARLARGGVLVAVDAGGKLSKSTPKSCATVKEVSSRRSAALKRLADR